SPPHCHVYSTDTDPNNGEWTKVSKGGRDKGIGGRPVTESEYHDLSAMMNNTNLYEMGVSDHALFCLESVGVATSEDKGKSIFLSDKTFKVFVVSDALAFFCSMTSLLMFLSAINGRYAEGDFILTLYLDCF
ncbi:ankyrin repeat protein, partial [Trifolium pratense]